MHEMTSDSDLVAHARDEAAVRRCWHVFKELRPHLDETEFVRRWRQQSSEGYQIVYIVSGARVVAAAGYRMLHTMAWGKIIYLDDLVALSDERGRGFGAQLLQWLQATARQHNCDAVHLDTGFSRFAAHRSYLRNGFRLDCHHLAWNAKAHGR
jgi:GNAT superfamily N-acetyltransferase